MPTLSVATTTVTGASPFTPHPPTPTHPPTPSPNTIPNTPHNPIAEHRPPARQRELPMAVAGKHVYMIGIGGCGMSGLARMLRGRGGIVSGSDSTHSPYTEMLEADGVTVGFDQSTPWLPEQCDLVIASAAIRPDHPQVMEAERRGVTVMNYAEALGQTMVGMTGICVAGTHGKSTTTATLGFILAEAGLDPNVIVGANCSHFGNTGFRLGAQAIPPGKGRGEPGLLVVEACEYNRSFHNYSPKIAVITSVEADHLDVYGSLEEVVKSFHEFAKLIPAASKGGVLLIADQNAHRREVCAGLECAVETIGWSPSADWSVQYEPESRRTGLIRKGQGLVAAWVTALPGDHNAMNSATACVLAIHAGADADTCARALTQFKGIDRRMQLLGERWLLGASSGVKVYDDYGHHPTEVETTLRALRAFERPEQRGGRLICVFQPHQHSRTRHLLEEFASAFSEADIVIVPHIYFVRDSIEEKTKVTAADLVDRLRSKGVQAMHLYPFEAIIEQLEVVCRSGDVVVVMGAGPVDTVARGFLEAGQAGTRPAGRIGRAGS
ncbi:MAG: UDP-N-acetylmuramate--L-alanine ligase [Phycisphaerales bacterium]|nr:UDP-N-acetylmuramate--L-alanine ligase [Phycisphaerales bacterium]